MLSVDQLEEDDQVVSAEVLIEGSLGERDLEEVTRQGYVVGWLEVGQTLVGEAAKVNVESMVVEVVVVVLVEYGHGEALVRMLVVVV